MSEPVSHNSTPICVVAFVLSEDESEVLLIESAKKGRRWELAGGKRQDIDTDIYAAIGRELEEETNIRIPVNAWEILDVFPGPPVSGANYASVIVIARVRGVRGQKPVAGTDAKNVGWFSRKAVLELELSPISSTDFLRGWAETGTISRGLPRS